VSEPWTRPSGKIRSALSQLSRNGCWGTCGACPRDGSGRVLPELCRERDRSDHHLTLWDLAQLEQRS